MSSTAGASRWVLCISILIALVGTLGAAIAPAAEGKIVELASGRYAGRDWAFAVNGPTPQQLEEAGLEFPFHFVVLTGIGNLCVEKVRAFDQSGHRLAKLSLPCEY
jgi:hypothetical protein